MQYGMVRWGLRCALCVVNAGLLSERITARYTMCVLLATQMAALVIFLVGRPNRVAIWATGLLCELRIQSCCLTCIITP